MNRIMNFSYHTECGVQDMMISVKGSLLLEWRKEVGK
jgi:hypothetical protein